ncbi:uncharacterized protein LOC144602358 [Rhinoraja longicauda]
MGRLGNPLWPLPLRPLPLLLAMLAAPCSGQLTLKASKSPAEVILYENALLECEIANLSAITLNPKNLGVLWVFTRGTEKLNIYTYSDGQITNLWAEAELPESSILNGNMSLFLRSVTLKHFGEYRCEVVIPPSDKASLTVNLEVLGRPTVTIVSEKLVEVGNGGELVLGCQLNGHYPCECNIDWVQSNPSQNEIKLLTDICIAPPIKNPDGTCNVTTEVRLEPRLEDIGSSFECRVTHKTFPEPYTVKAAVALKEAEIHLSKGSIVGSILGSVFFSVMVLAAGIYLYMRCIYKVPPNMCDLQMPARFIHQQLAEITCHVSGFRPAAISAGWYLRRKNDTKETFICENNSDQWIIRFDKEKKITETGKRNATNVNWKVRQSSFVVDDDGTWSFSSTLEIYPDLMEDNKAQIIFRVSHPTGTQMKCSCLQVDGIAPKLGNIIKPPVVRHNSSVMLTCPISFFTPRPLTINWYERTNGVKSLLLDHTEENVAESTVGRYSHCLRVFTYPDHTYSVHSILTFIATIQENNGKEYICEVNHVSLKQRAEKQVKLEVKAFPSLDTILSEPVNPEIDKVLTLSCKVHSFYPKEISVQWVKDKKAIEENKTSEIIENQENKLYEFTTTCTIIPTLADRESKYQCLVTHESLPKPKFVEYVPENLVSSPRVNEITCDPLNPEVGKTLTLSCKIMDFYPGSIQINWFRDEVRINEDTKYGIVNKELTNEHSRYSKVTKLTLRPSINDHQTEYKVEVYHSKSSTKPQMQCFQLLLEGLPKISDFKMVPAIPWFGEDLSISCSVCDLLRKDFIIEWYRGSKPMKSGVTNSDFVLTPDNNYKVESCLKFLVTAEDFEREIIFLCKGRYNSEAFERRIQLPLKAVPPIVTSIINCDNDRLRIDGKATLTCSIEHFCPMDIKVAWCKGRKDCTDRQIMTKPKIDGTGLYSAITQLPILIAEKSANYVCEVRHVKTNEIVEKPFTLQV